MRIQDLFEKDIFRPINGVVKADQLDESSVWQELEEFVVTKELDQHLRRFFTSYCDAMDRTGDADVEGKMGVWISGFFGSGKSHFIKVLSYLLGNQDHAHEGQTKRAVEFFDSKVKDAMLLGDIKRAVASDTDVILFNIDNKADSRAGRDAILAVFLKVLNELQGYSGDHPHIAHMERYLEGKAKLGDFYDAYRMLTGSHWVDERDAYEFNRDEVIKALSQTLGQSEQSCEKWLDGAEDNFALTVENFCKWVKDYLDGRGGNRRIVFLVDEVGQFIGTDTHLMLNLQTITEELGTICKGRAWVVVTSQEDIDAVLGEMPGTRANDFSKIQGRFRARLSLSSANVDEVIQERLLAKRENVRAGLESEYAKQGDIINNQLSFREVGTTFPQFTDADDFVRNYPFAPYQFKLLQKIFESIRKAGATGLHLAQGERSLLDAFQHAGQSVANMEVGVLVPLYRFYPSIESFLDTGVKRTIDHAKNNDSLEDFDTQLLEVLFLIRYVDEVKGNVDNLATLCLDQIDADKLALRRTIEASLQRLERQTLISRSGDTYFFLTSEERDINREIKNVAVGSAEEAKLLGELVFDDLLKGHRKHRYQVNKKDFSFNRLCDLHPVGNRVEGALVVSILTPLLDGYDDYQDGKCVLDSGQDGGQVLIRLRDDENLERELRAYLRTEKYIRTKDDGTMPPATKRIHRDLAEENRIRRERLTELLGEMLADASYFVAGQRLTVASSTPQSALDEAMKYLIENTFAKMGYLKTLCDEPVKEIQAVLSSDDIAQHNLGMDLPEGNPRAIEDIRDYIELCTKTSRQMVLFDMVTGRYANRPYGWPAFEVVLLLSKLYISGEVQFVSGGAAIPKDKLYEALTTQGRRWRGITVVQRARAKPEEVKQARELGREVFAEMGPVGEDALFEFLKDKLESWREKLNNYRALAGTGSYPGGEDIARGRRLVNGLLSSDASNAFLARFNERRADLLDLSDAFHELKHFYEHQRAMWDRLQAASTRFMLNRMELDRDDVAGPALLRMSEILASAHPYKLVKEAEGLIQTVGEVNDAMLSTRRAMALDSIGMNLKALSRDIVAAGADNELKSVLLAPLEKLIKQVADYDSLAHISQAETEAVRLRDEALTKAEQSLAKKAEEGKAVEDKPVFKPRRVVSPVKLVQATYLETQADVDVFLDDLRAELSDALSNNQRIEIR